MIKKSAALLLLALAGCAAPTAFHGTPEPSDEFEILLSRHDQADWARRIATQDLRSNDFLMQLRKVNGYINSVPYRGEETDTWRTPREFMSRGGDCEDYAIAKYMTLKALGVSDDDMRIAIYPDPLRKAGHAVLVVRHGGREWVLDYLPGSGIHQVGMGAVKTLNADGWRYLDPVERKRSLARKS